jgi:hypothetical protein
MYRIIDVPGIFDLLAEHNLGGQTCTLKLTIDDSFLPESAGSTLLRFEEGHVQRLDAGQPDAEVRLPIEDLSSMLVNSGS